MPMRSRPVKAALLALAFAAASFSACDSGKSLGRVRPQVDVEPAAIDFGQAAPGARVERTLALFNRGQGRLTVREWAVVGANASSFSVGRMGPAELEAGGSTVLTLAYAPGAAGQHSARLVLLSDAENAPELWVSLAGSAVAGDPCAGVTCAQPPGPCFQPAGTCALGVCTYTPRPMGTPCDDGDACTPTSACDAAGACTGTSMVCSTPPAASCVGAGTSRTWDPVGACSQGACGYSSLDTACAFGCDGGRCRADACEGVSCSAPGACETGPGTCDGGACTYPRVTSCLGGDGCCPAGCTLQTDSDCAASCPRGRFACDGGCCGAQAVIAGSRFSCALLSGGGVKCWGHNDVGTVGDGTTTTRFTPVGVVGLSSGVVALTGKFAHACALLSSGAMRCWGRNLYGELGNGTTSGSAGANPVPVSVTGLPLGVQAIGSSFASTFALTSSGTLASWGYNEYGELANGTWAHSAVPGSVSGSYRGVGANCAVTSTGALRCWGWNGYGQVGDGTTTNRNVPTQVAGLNAAVTSTDLGWAHTCAVVDGGVSCWGYNARGQVGDGTIQNRLQPVPVTGLGSGVAKVTAGNNHTCALTTAGSVLCWGENDHGQLGDGTRTQRSTPAAVVGLSSIVDVAAGSYHTCAVSSPGEVRCWGYNWLGAVGIGDTQSSDELVPVGVLAP